MSEENIVAALLAKRSTEDGQSSLVFYVAIICLIWYTAVTLVSTLGYVQVRRYFSRAAPEVRWSQDAPHVNIVRPVKGLEPSLYDCLASTFRQTYPREKLHIRFCISDRGDPALPVLERLVKDFPAFDAQILVEDEDVALQNRQVQLGPNPKIRNMSRAYREAIGDFIWIIDCNVWVAKGVCGRLVAKLEGRGEKRKNKFVHQLPLVVDTLGTTTREETRGLLDDSSSQIRTTSSASNSLLSTRDDERTASSIGGGRLEELFLSSAHAKFYTAINTVLIAPCIVGKSTMFRRRHLDSLTDGAGIDYFSENICEDHLIGDTLWRKYVPEELDGESWGKHACCFGDLAVQPMANMSVAEYWRRRVRWLRVRKYTVTLATFVEPGTESFLCSLYGAFAVTTLPFFETRVGIPPTWSAFAIFWLCSVSAWCLIDRTLYLLLHSGRSIETDDDTPAFARSPQDGRRRSFRDWLFAWIGREALALPIWTWAVYGGATVEWRGKKLWVGMDMKVHEFEKDTYGEQNGYVTRNGPVSRSSSRDKARVD